jgi:4-oxalmesaconate hydratase
MMIIDAHGHYTTVPPEAQRFRQAQLAAADPAAAAAVPLPAITDDEIRASIEGGQLAMMRERGVDVTIFSPRASTVAPHLGTPADNIAWARVSNDLIARVCALFPKQFIGVCQLPPSQAGDMQDSIRELERCVNELGFVGANLNPDPSGGSFSSPPLYDRSWYPLYEKMCELDVPAMIHVSGACNPAFHTTGSYYIAADTVAFMQFIQGDVFRDFPSLRLIVPHGGGAVPYHWGRYRGMAQDMKRPPIETLFANVFFDTCVYHQPGIDLLFEVVPPENILFASEMIGAVRGIDDRTGHYYDDTKRYVEALKLDATTQRKVFEENAYRVYPRLRAKLASG